MIKNYFKIALRNIKRYSTYSILNITGMAIGMASAILILLWVQFEWSYDRYFKNADDLYRVTENQYFSGGEVSSMAATPGALSSALKKEYPEIIRSSRYSNPPFALHKGDIFINEKIAMVDKDFLKMFDIKFIRGDINNALNEPHNIVITEVMANKYFSNEDPLGKTLTAIDMVFTVSGVVKSLPRNSHLQFDILFSFEGLGVPIDDWRVRCYNYLELKKGTESKTVDNKIRDFLKNNKRESNSEIFLQNIKKIHLFSSRKYVYDISGHGDITYVRILSLVAVFILIIACINFMNLSTAQSARRSREIGIRKMAGANKRKIIVQFLGESLLIVLMAHLIAMILVELLLPGFNNLTGKHLDVDYRSAGLYIGLITVILFCGLLAGSYPALYLSSLKPLDTIKGIFTKNPGNTRFRKILVIFQFSLSIILIICTLIVGNQLNYLQNKNLGFNKDDIGYFQFPIRPGDPLLGTIKQELGNNQDIESITMGDSPINTEWTTNGYNWTGEKMGDDVLFHRLGVDENYARTFQLMIKEGRFFSSEFSTDANAIVINEQAARIMGFKEPVGELLTTAQGAKLTIIGVVQDFHFQSLHYKIGPLIMHIGASNVLFVRIKPDKITSTVDYIEKTYKSFNPSSPLDFHFLDDDFDNLYRTEQRIGKIFGSFSFLAIIISCLGLIGLSSFMTERRTKEIGIRKINGAKSIEIFSLLSREYLIWVMISIIIACPIAWYAMYKWLQNFAYGISIGWWTFALAGVVALLIALLTVSIQSYRAASKNPVEALRYE
ncbi:MAG: FtsX-like permease family protein [Bacteroidales bacterium]|jgi:ABC-type antimicrobial peptide transport system permease subunit